MMRTRKQLYIVGYDISCNKQRRRVEKLLTSLGTRANKSLFECMLTPASHKRLLARLPKMIDASSDTVVLYRVCLDCYADSTRIPYKRQGGDSVVVL